MPHITTLPAEILDNILKHVVALNEQEGVAFTFGISQLPRCADKSVSTRVQRYVKGPTPPYQAKWDAANKLRQVCRRWHAWSLQYALRDVYVKLWRGSERWADLSLQRDKYALYEMIDYPRGEKVYRDSYSTLRRTRDFFQNCPQAAAHVRRLWFNGLYTPEADQEILAIIHACPHLTSVSAPWTILRHGSPANWAALLSVDGTHPLQSLELTATRLSEVQQADFAAAPILNALASPMVDFSKLRRLKLFGNTESLPISDADLLAIARTATNIEEFQLTCISTVSIEGVMAIVRSSRKTLRVLEHSPRSDDGFHHPHPGNLALHDTDHICALLTSCPQLRDLSISIPTLCAELFSNHHVRWTGDCQVRALGLCSHGRISTGAARQRRPSTNATHAELRSILDAARALIAARARSFVPADLRLELFFANMIFDPHVSQVHGGFADARLWSGGSWPVGATVSRKGPYGSTGLYGKEYDDDDESDGERESGWECVREEELFAGLARRMVMI